MKNKAYILQKNINGSWVFSQQYNTQPDAIEGLRFYIEKTQRIGGSNIFRIINK
tara:strand:+ start:52 stop:213 length:162 start_codon:yes stop_codon:yes gene_type:complete